MFHVVIRGYEEKTSRVKQSHIGLRGRGATFKWAVRNHFSEDGTLG